jgi:tetratricopeptide (TPR) repeat protein
MGALRIIFRAALVCGCALALLVALPVCGRSSSVDLLPETQAILQKIYSFDLDGAVEDAKRMQKDSPDQPLGYLLESEALWWRIWCTSAEFKYGMTDVRHRAKLEADKHYLELSSKVLALAEAENKKKETAEMQFYAGMAEASLARLYGLRGENRNAARSGVRGREHLLRAKALDADFVDADMGLGLYDYYVDTLNGIAKILRFFMGIPGGSKQEGVQLLERAVQQGVLTPNEARFYLALNLHRYDLQYEKALKVLSPLVEKYPGNPLFQLARGDLLAKLGRKEQAMASYRAAGAITAQDAACQARLQELVRLSIATLSSREEK